MSAFDQPPSRQASHASKLVDRQSVFGRGDVIPLWVADMDFACPAAIQDAIAQRAKHPIYGYTTPANSLIEALLDWLTKRHRWQGQVSQVRLVNAAVPALYAASQAFSQPGQGVIVMPPAYPPLFDAAQLGHRRLISCPLLLRDGQYHIDFTHFEACAKDARTKLLLWCSPHNPSGRVWSTDELQGLLEIARRHGLCIVSDEVHADLGYPDRRRHHLLHSLAEPDDAVITLLAPGKSFNTQGLGLAALLSQRADLLNALSQQLNSTLGLSANPFSMVAFEAGYRHAGPWLNQLIAYLQINRDRAIGFFRRQQLGITVMEPQASCLLWLDCRQLGLDDQGLEHFFVHQAGVGLSPGVRFGQQGSGFMRMNIASPTSVIDQALAQIGQAACQDRAAP